MPKYNPRYDPLVDSSPGQGVDYAPTYWLATAGKAPKLDKPVSSDLDVDVAIIGSGFTGLATALFLAEEYNIKATILEANELAWGCTSRNGGQGQLNCGRLSRSQWLDRWGKDVAVRLHNDVVEGFDLFKSLLARDAVDCDPQGDGHVLLAHRRSMVGTLRKRSELERRVFNYKTSVLSKEELIEQYVDDKEIFGGLLEPEGVGVHPLKLAYSYARMVKKLGAIIRPSSPVTGWRSENGVHYLQTPGGVVKARRVAVATGGYTGSGLHKDIAWRYMPILSNSVVTRVLNEEEIKASGLKTHLVMTDTRNLRFYYRLLPDNRVHMGTRSAITGQDAGNVKHYDLLVQGLYRKFPALQGVDIDYSWWGWVDVSHDMMPRIVESSPGSGIFYSLGYGGNGVAFSVHGGRKMADRIAGKFSSAPDLPIYNSPLPKHTFTPFRRIGQRALYHYYQILDLLP